MAACGEFSEASLLADHTRRSTCSLAFFTSALASEGRGSTPSTTGAGAVAVAGAADTGCVAGAADAAGAGWFCSSAWYWATACSALLFIMAACGEFSEASLLADHTRRSTCSLAFFTSSNRASTSRGWGAASSFRCERRGEEGQGAGGPPRVVGQQACLRELPAGCH